MSLEQNRRSEQNKEGKKRWQRGKTNAKIHTRDSMGQCGKLKQFTVIRA